VPASCRQRSAPRSRYKMRRCRNDVT
jgi:hypothetical protein